MDTGSCPPIESLRAAVASFRHAEGPAIAEEARRFRDTATRLCDSVAVLMNMALGDADAALLFAPEAATLPTERLEDGREALLDNLGRYCLACGGRSPFGI